MKKGIEERDKKGREDRRKERRNEERGCRERERGKECVWLIYLRELREKEVRVVNEREGFGGCILQARMARPRQTHGSSACLKEREK